MKYGYARVSTSGQDVEAQIQVLKANGCDKIFSEHFTGTLTERPQFSLLLSALKSGDILIITKLDRFARSATKGSELIKQLLEMGVAVHILNMGLLDNTPASKLIRNIFFAFAEFERDMIVDRTQDGKQIAKQKPDFKEGRPKKYTRKQLEHAMQLLQENSYKQVTELTGISKSTLVRERKKII